MVSFPYGAQIAPVENAVSITASASDFAGTRSIFIETAGSFTIQFVGASSAVTMTLPVGTHPFCIKKCTAGTGLWACY